MTDERLLEMYISSLLIRAFDSRLPDLYTKGLVRGSSHAAIGQEAVAVGACAALEPDDYITSTHRGHGHAIAKGAKVERMMSELLGRVDGYCRGKGGSMHIADFSIGMLGANAIVGGGFGISTGAALSASVLRNGRVALCFFGDGAINQGAFYECANMAAIWQLPLILLCENNQFAMSARVEQMTRGRLADRGLALGIPSAEVDGMDAEAVHDAVRAAAERARAGAGPSLIIATCYRMAGHFSGDSQHYRTRDEVSAWAGRDPLLLLRKRLVAGGVLTEEAADELRLEAEQHVARAIEQAKSQPWPEPDAAFEDVYA